MAFWAPFLLLHLGGQDNITAYSIEDNRLWLRHLQSFAVEVLAAAYILYQSSIVARRTLLRPAAILMFAVGVVKYLERVSALKLASSSNLSGSNYQSFFRKIKPTVRSDFYDEDFNQAHLLLEFPKHLLKGPLPLVTVDLDYCCDWETIYGVAEIQLSLMHEVFYSKAELIYTWYGYCIRVFSLVATIATLVLFCRFSEKDGYRRADVAATYVLVVGAVVVEMASVLRAISSTWILGTHVRRVVRIGSLWHTIIAILYFPFMFPLVIWALAVHMRKGICVAARYWSHSMGQHNFIHMCSHCKNSRSSKIARWVGREDWWNMLIYTSSVPVSEGISELLQKYIEKSQVTIYKKIELHSGDRAGLYEELGWSVHREKLDASILVWHIATHVYLSWYEAEKAGRQHARDPLVQVTKELSNYMMFLLAARPYMLPDSASRQRYVHLCNMLVHVLEYSTEDDLLKLIREPAQANSGPINPEQSDDDTFHKACLLSATLISKHKRQETPDASMLELISQVWAELLCHAAYWCKPDSHVRRLSDGSELTTLVAFLLQYKEQGILQSKPVEEGTGNV